MYWLLRTCCILNLLLMNLLLTKDLLLMYHSYSLQFILCYVPVDFVRSVCYIIFELK